MLGTVEYRTVGDEGPPIEIDDESKVLNVLVPVSGTELLVTVEAVVKSIVLD